ncbi:MAG: response regulator transcription factor [Nitrospiraceae bacterium]|nr:response regulator transcription factor [Nitrospiraceae bacterium]
MLSLFVMLTGPSPIVLVRDSVLIFLKSEPFAQSLKRTLETSGYRSIVVTMESVALKEAEASVPSLIILDRRSISITNFRRIRTLNTVPIIAVQEGLSCHDEDCLEEYDQDIDLVVCGESVRELVARARAMLRRPGAGVESRFQYSAGNLRMDLDRHEVLINGHVVDLTPKEFQILQHFLKSPRRVFSRQEMLNEVWGEGYALEEHALDVHIHSLRQKIEADPANPKFLLTVRGVGYKVQA